MTQSTFLEHANLTKNKLESCRRRVTDWKRIQDARVAAGKRRVKCPSGKDNQRCPGRGSREPETVTPEMHEHLLQTITDPRTTDLHGEPRSSARGTQA